MQSRQTALRVEYYCDLSNPTCVFPCCLSARDYYFAGILASANSSYQSGSDRRLTNAPASDFSNATTRCCRGPTLPLRSTPLASRACRPEYRSAHTHPACVFPYWQSARGCWYAGTPASVNSNCQNGADPQERAAAVLAPALGQTARITMQKPKTTFS